MICDPIFVTPLCGDDTVDNFFSRIVSAQRTYDVSLLSTARALLFKRIPADEGLVIYDIGNVVTLRTRRIGGVQTIPEFVREFTGDSIYDCHNTLWVFQATDHDERTQELTEHHWVKLDKIAQFFAPAYQVTCLVNEELKSTIVLYAVPQRENAVGVFHAIQRTMLAWFPWYVKNEGVSPTDIEVMSAVNDSAAQYIAVLKKIYDGYNIENDRISMIINNFCSGYKKKQMDEIMDAIAQYNSRLEALESQIRDVLANRRQREIMLTGLSASDSDDGGRAAELMDFFRGSDNLHVVSGSSGRLVYDVVGYLDMFDEELAEKCITGHSIDIRDEKRADVELLLKAVFIDKTMSIRTRGRFALSLPTTLSAAADFQADDPTCLPNPHLWHHGCTGQNRYYWAQMLDRGDILLAINQSIASARNINFGDYVVTKEFCQDLTSRAFAGYHFITDSETGEALTYAQAVKRLREKEGE